MLGAATARALAGTGVAVVVTSLDPDDDVGRALTSQGHGIQLEVVDLADLHQVEALFSAHRFDGVVFTVQTHQAARTRDASNRIYSILLNVLETARKTGAERAVVGSSMAVYGGLNPPYDENVTFPPIIDAPPGQDHGILLESEVMTKRIVELIALDYAHPFKMGLSVPAGTVKPEPHELEVVVLRAPMMFGPGYRALGSPLGLAAHVAAGRLDGFRGCEAYGGVPIEKAWPALAGVPTNYVKDNAACIALAMTAASVPHRVYNVSSGFTTSPRAQLEALLRAAPECAERMGITPNELPGDAPDVGFNGARFAADFGWTSPFSLESALVDYIAWLGEHPY